MNRAEAIEFAKEQQEIFGGKMGEFLEYVENELTQTNASNTLNALDCDDTISRQAAIEAFKKELTMGLEKEVMIGKSESKYITICSAIGYEGAKKILESLPSAERRGQWLKTATLYPYCSECDWMPEEDEMTHGFYRYCPNCGARMECD